MSSLEQAEAFLSAREIDRALEAYAALERDCAEPDRLSGGRWMCHMLAGEYARAWRESDAIRGRGAVDAHRFWQGEAIDGRRVMVRCLHGYGDTVMYLRWLPMLRGRASAVVVQAAPEMFELLGRMVGVDRVVTWNAEGTNDRELWDVQVECAELPYLFRATAETLPMPARLVFPEARQHAVRGLLGQRTKPRVGLVWKGSNYDAARSIPFLQLRELLRDHAVELWSLQSPENNGEWDAFVRERGWGARTFYGAGGTHAGIADMAAFAQEMDLVITIDTLAAHVAGSLGVPTGRLLTREADWRWMLEREDSPWYPTMRLFRQETAGDWNAVLVRVCERLRDWCEEQKA